MVLAEIASIPELIATHPEEIFIWSHGFFVALALRRGRIEALIERVIPSSKGEE